LISSRFVFESFVDNTTKIGPKQKHRKRSRNWSDDRARQERCRL